MSVGRSATGTIVVAAALLLSMTAYFGAAPKPGSAENEPDAKASVQSPPAAPPADGTVDPRIVVGFGYIDVDGGAVPLAFKAVGQIEQVLVKENQKVSAGAPLAKLRSIEVEQQVQMAQAAVDEAKVRLEEAKRAPANQDLLLAQQEQAIAGVLSKVEGQRRQVNQLKNLSESNSVSADTFLGAKDQLQSVEAMLKGEELKLRQLKLQNPQESIRRAEAGLRSADGQLQLAKEQLHNHTLWAPGAGWILRVLVSPGQIWGPSATEPAIWFCPDKPRIIRCEINQRFARRVQQGQSATVFDDVDETKLGTGIVERCSLWISHRRSLIDEPLQRNDVRTLECFVQFRPDDPSSAALRIGERVRVVIQTDSPAK